MERVSGGPAGQTGRRGPDCLGSPGSDVVDQCWKRIAPASRGQQTGEQLGDAGGGGGAKERGRSACLG